MNKGKKDRYFSLWFSLCPSLNMIMFWHFQYTSYLWLGGNPRKGLSHGTKTVEFPSEGD